MTTVTSTLTVEAKNELLRHLNNLSLNESDTENKIAAVNATNSLVGATTFTFGSASDGEISNSGNIVIEIPLGETINGIRYYKTNEHGNDNVIEPISITPTTFTYGGKIVITQIKVTLT